MKRIYVTYLFIALLIASCGKSAKEQQLENVKKELELAKNQLTLKEKEEREKVKQLELAQKEEEHQQKWNVGKKKKVTQLNDLLQEASTALSTAELERTQINEFQIGRSSATKEYELRNQRKKINDLASYIKKIKNTIAELEYQKTFEFQSSPESVMNHIFEAAKKEDISNFKYLCDPYSENDSDVNYICYAEILLEQGKKELIANFSNGRIIGESKIENDRAEIEFAYGPNSDRLEKANLIKRNEKWYLMSF
ncbi:hypothetical protein RM545_13770 [Zunongwangia sp. F260]|uniref:Uncharacterized protein n=1 Tax=Autumnicola lenta TaxID=3075593 RepID=A0ABU3CN28_9FLAO|nr:hypothetical protein [Zunongwangia sp. F260]MDT0647763.1 hypothetical protein [Zunongwangia sp. F260]